MRLVQSPKEYIRLALALCAVLLFSLSIEYYNYCKVTETPYYKTTAKIVKAYEKTAASGKTYTVLRLLAAEGFKFYTTAKTDYSQYADRELSLVIKSTNITFLDYLRGFFAQSYKIELLPYHPGANDAIAAYITAQHDEPLLKELFLSLFLESSVSDELQQIITNFGLSAVMSLSGLNLTLLSSFLLLAASPLYIFFQRRYFPYRSREKDLGLFLAVLMFGYMYLVNFMPAFARSYAMMIFLFSLRQRGFDISSFELLYISAAALFAAFPRLFFDIGFWLSVLGVWCIFIFLKYAKGLNPRVAYGMLTIWIYFAMLPIVHYIFASFSFAQLTSPLSSVVFDIFYPVQIVLHLFNIGWLFDKPLLWLLSIPVQSYELKAPLWFFLAYLAIMFFSTMSKQFFYLLNGSMAVFFLTGVFFNVLR